MQVAMAILLTLSGLPTLFGGPQPGSLSEVLPAALVYAVAGVFTGGGALIVAAAAVRNPELALYLELTAAAPLMLMLSTYAGAALSVAGLRAAFAAALALGLAVAFSVRAVKVYQTIRGLREKLGKHK